MRRQPGTARGFTVVELMVAMVIAGILISLIFAVYTKMSSAYQAQGRVTDVIQNLRAGQARLVQELRMAGNQLPMPDYQPTEIAGGPPNFASRGAPANFTHDPALFPAQGLSVAPTIAPPGQNPGDPLQPIYITNGGGMEPDQIRFYWADVEKAAKVDDTPPGTNGFPNDSSLNLADPTGSGTVASDNFASGDLIIVVNTENEEISMDVTGDATVETFEITAVKGCLLHITTASANNLVFSPGPPSFNPAGTAHCNEVRNLHDLDLARPAAARADTMVYKLEGRSYRIDPTRREIGVLQVNDNGELLDNVWTDLGIGFTNLQVASRWYESGRATANLDAAYETTPDLERNWYSGENQEFPDPDATATRRPDWATMISIAITLESRSYAPVDSAGTSSITYGPSGDHTPFSDMATLSLPDADLRYAEPHIFRYSTVVVDFRNMARGR